MHRRVAMGGYSLAVAGVPSGFWMCCFEVVVGHYPLSPSTGSCLNPGLRIELPLDQSTTGRHCLLIILLHPHPGEDIFNFERKFHSIILFFYDYYFRLLISERISPLPVKNVYNG